MDEVEALAGLLGKEPKSSENAAGLKAIAHAPADGSPADIGMLLLGVVLAAAWIAIAAHAIGWVLEAGLVGSLLDGAGIDIVANAIIFGGLLLITVLMLRIAPVSPPLHVLAAFPAWGLGLVMGLAGLVTALLMAWVGGHVRIADQPLPITTGLLIVGTAMTLFQVSVEEFLFRGWLQVRLARITSPTLAVVGAAAAFSVLHLAGGVRSPMSLTNIFLAGLLFGALLHKTGSLFAAIGAHFAWNWSEGILFGLAPNPGAPAYGAIFDLDLGGSSLWGGSDEGLNAAISVSLALAALIIPLLAAPSQDQPE